MSSSEEPVETQKLSDEPEVVSVIKDRASRRRWRLFGWTVIGLMIGLIILNMAGLRNPDVNKVAMITFVAAYLVYVIFRRR
ncbi:MAG: hypothetical protein KDC45_08030 [Bacteroidetes bacterium]|nr:hypothetical protein [Bacteroidota bacterium]